VLKAKTLITLSKTLKKTHIKALEKAIVIKEVEEVVIYQNNKSHVIILLKRFKNKN
jgi:hypothetical protein